MGSFGNHQGFMCNGANFAYTKAFFTELGGFDGLNQYAGGDDVLLLQKALQQQPQKVGYIKSVAATVETRAIDDLFEVLQQRIRWAAKSTGYSNSYAKVLAVVVLLMNLCWVTAVMLAFNNEIQWPIVISIWAVKYAADFIVMYRANDVLRGRKFFLPLASSVVYPFFSSVTGICSLFGGFQWKGRTFRR
jgi:cellulose synthase/poly-beta-1,6-N-acetylglucosamine synthase-like glycosyltransferase